MNIKSLLGATMATALLYLGVIVSTPITFLRLFVAIMIKIDIWAGTVINQYWAWVDASWKERNS